MRVKLNHPPCYVLFKPDRPNGIQLPDLPANTIPLMPHRSIKPFSVVVDGVKCSVSRLQVRLLPCYAMTIAKCQGQNIHLTIADISVPPSGNKLTVSHIYVAFSRSAGRDKLRVLRNLTPTMEKLLMQRVNEFLRIDDARLVREALDTKDLFRDGTLFDSVRFAAQYDDVQANSQPDHGVSFE